MTLHHWNSKNNRNIHHDIYQEKFLDSHMILWAIITPHFCRQQLVYHRIATRSNKIPIKMPMLWLISMKRRYPMLLHHRVWFLWIEYVCIVWNGLGLSISWNHYKVVVKQLKSLRPAKWTVVVWFPGWIYCRAFHDNGLL